MSEWISVKDRLPEKDGKYVVWSDGELNICEYDVESQTFGDTFYDYDEMYSKLLCWDDDINKFVTHWLPTKPPKGEIGMDDYIIREEVVKEIKSRIFAADDAWESGYNTAMAGIMEWIEHMPSADVQPVKHGRWIYQGYNMWLCSYCKENLIYSETESDRAEKQQYCSRCGARMDGDSE